MVLKNPENQAGFNISTADLDGTVLELLSGSLADYTIDAVLNAVRRDQPGLPDSS